MKMIRSFDITLVLLVAVLFSAVGCGAPQTDEADGVDDSSTENASTESPPDSSESNTNEEESAAKPDPQGFPPDGREPETVTSRPMSAEEAEKIIEEELRKFYRDGCSDDEATRIAALDAILVQRKHLVFLFGESGTEKVWGKLEERFGEMRKDTAGLKKSLSGKGEVKAIKLINVREKDATRGYADVLAAIPKTVPVYRATTTFENGSGGMSSLLILDGHLVWIRRLTNMHDSLKKSD